MAQCMIGGEIQMVQFTTYKYFLRIRPIARNIEQGLGLTARWSAIDMVSNACRQSPASDRPAYVQVAKRIMRLVRCLC